MKRGLSLLLALVLCTACFAAFADAAYEEGLALLAEEKYYSAYVAFSNSTDERAEAQAEKCEQPWPKNGEVWRGDNVKYGSMELVIDVNQDDDTAYFARIYKGAKLVSCVFIKGSGQVTVQLPGGVYMIKDGTGRRWFGVKEAFGRFGSYETMIYEDGTDKINLQPNYRYTLTVNVEHLDPDADEVDSDSISWEEFTQD